MPPLLLAFLVAVAPPPGATAGVLALHAGAGAAPHDLHVTYGQAAVDGRHLVIRFRFFRDDLEAALGRHIGTSVLTMGATEEVDRVFLSYLEERFQVEVAGERLPVTVVARGEDMLDREPVWWYALEFTAPAELRSFHVRNTLLFELFDDQRNVVKFVHFPDQAQRTVAFARGEETFTVTFGSD